MGKDLVWRMEAVLECVWVSVCSHRCLFFLGKAWKSIIWFPLTLLGTANRQLNICKDRDRSQTA